MSESPSHTRSWYAQNARKCNGSSRFRRILGTLAFALVVASILGASALVVAGFCAGLVALTHTDGWERVLAGVGICGFVYLVCIWSLARSGR